jgi:hypothetical protein
VKTTAQALRGHSPHLQLSRQVAGDGYPSKVLPGALLLVAGWELRLPVGVAVQGKSRGVGIVPRQPNKRLEQTPPSIVEFHL